MVLFLTSSEWNHYKLAVGTTSRPSRVIDLERIDMEDGATTPMPGDDSETGTIWPNLTNLTTPLAQRSCWEPTAGSSRMETPAPVQDKTSGIKRSWVDMNDTELFQEIELRRERLTE